MAQCLYRCRQEYSYSYSYSYSQWSSDGGVKLVTSIHLVSAVESSVAILPLHL